MVGRIGVEVQALVVLDRGIARVNEAIPVRSLLSKVGTTALFLDSQVGVVADVFGRVPDPEFQPALDVRWGYDRWLEWPNQSVRPRRARDILRSLLQSSARAQLR